MRVDFSTEILDAVAAAEAAARAGDASLAAAWTGIADLRMQLMSPQNPIGRHLAQSIGTPPPSPAPPEVSE